MARTNPLIVIVATLIAFLLCKIYVWSAFVGVICKYPIWYQSIFPDASLYYVGLVILSMLSVLVSGICFVTIAGITAFFLRDITK
jgi:hypothetical protein